MAKAAGVGRSTVQRIWDAHGLQPHRVTTFKLSTDPAFTEKLTDVVGLYLNPPDKAVVLCVDEKSQIQALDRTQPGLPMKPRRRGTMTHDYKRHGTTRDLQRLKRSLEEDAKQCECGGDLSRCDLLADLAVDDAPPSPATRSRDGEGEGEDGHRGGQ